MQEDNRKEVANTVREEISEEKSVEKLRTEYLNNYKEQKALKKFKKNDDYSSCMIGFLIKNKRTGNIVEIRAPSIVMAAEAVGWRMRHTILLEEVKYDS